MKLSYLAPLLCATTTTTQFTVHAFAVKQVAGSAPAVGKTRGGGRAPSENDHIVPLDGEKWEATPNEDGECRLIICQITDVYTLGKSRERRDGLYCAAVSHIDVLFNVLRRLTPSPCRFFFSLSLQ